MKFEFLISNSDDCWESNFSGKEFFGHGTEIVSVEIGLGNLQFFGELENVSFGILLDGINEEEGESQGILISSIYKVLVFP